MLEDNGGRRTRDMTRQAKLCADLERRLRDCEQSLGAAEAKLSRARKRSRARCKNIREITAQYRELECVHASQGRRLRTALRKADRQAELLEIAKGEFFTGGDHIGAWLASLDFCSTGPDWPPDVVTIGNGPVFGSLLDGFLIYLGYECYEPGHEDSGVMVVGRDIKEFDGVEKQIGAREGNTLRVYSQEMAIIAMVTGHDPFDCDKELLLEFGVGHPVLSYLAESELSWPEIQAPIALPSQPLYSSVDESPLHAMGYRAGKTVGRSTFMRRLTLRRAFEDDLAWGEWRDYSDEYMDEWGQPNTRQRLWRIAHHLAWLIKTRQPNDPRICG